MVSIGSAVLGVAFCHDFPRGTCTFTVQSCGPAAGQALQKDVVQLAPGTQTYLEATFLGVMLVGRDRVSPHLDFFACCIVSLGSLFSSFWILANNSWMEVPVGHLTLSRRSSDPISTEKQRRADGENRINNREGVEKLGEHSDDRQGHEYERKKNQSVDHVRSHRAGRIRKRRRLPR
jgi:hypothetical protein